MRAFMLDGFLDFSYFFEDYIDNNPILEKSTNVQFFIFDPTLTTFEYIYNSTVTGAAPMSVKELKVIILDNEPENTKGFIDVHTVLEEESTRIFISVKNPIFETKTYVATMCINFDSVVSTNKILENLNFGYIEHFLFHIQALINNYEKLFYLIDTYCELFAAKDSYMPHHMSNVANWCTKISNELELNERDNKILYISALLHDVGKIFLPDSIFSKPTKLNDKELELVKDHPVKSYHLLKSTLYGMTFFQDVPAIVKHHHEKFDGSGYPDGLSGEDIPYLSRILAVADSIDAMMTSKPYQEAKEVSDIMEELINQSGIQFDPLIARAAVNAIEDNYQNTSTMILKKTKFIANASLRFYFGDYKTINSLQGNLIIKDENAIFILNSSCKYNPDWNLSRIFLPTISFLENKDLYEFKCTMENLSSENIELSKIAYTPTDKFFSLVLNSTITLNKSNVYIKAEMLKLGGDTLVLQVHHSENEKISENFGGNFNVEFEPELSSEIAITSLLCRIGKIYNSGDKTIYILNYIDITSSQRDVLLKFLFKKQIEYKQTLKNAK
ncbi:MAG: HD-GYP domain-containing protein [Proteocatella sp.]